MPPVPEPEHRRPSAERGTGCQGIRFPAVPGIDIDGETVAFDPIKTVPIF